MLFADFPIPGVTHLEIIEAGLQVLENDVIGPVTVESIRLMKNQITSIEEDAFRQAHLLWFFVKEIYEQKVDMSTRTKIIDTKYRKVMSKIDNCKVVSINITWARVNQN